MFMKRIVSSTLISISLTACSPIDSVHPFDNQQAANLIKEWYVKKPAQQRISIALKDKHNWKRIDLSLHTQGSPIMLIPLDQTASHWNESIRTDLRPYSTHPDMTASQYVTARFTVSQSDCKHNQTKLISTTKEYVIYSIVSDTCKSTPNFLEVGKAFNGRDAIYVVYYTALNNQISSAEINERSRLVEKAQLVDNPRAYD